jgi:hypothetical protein
MTLLSNLLFSLWLFSLAVAAARRRRKSDPSRQDGQLAIFAYSRRCALMGSAGWRGAKEQLA